MILLPPNATKSEINIAGAIDYEVDPKILAGFKFDSSNLDTQMKLALSWEYSLSQIAVEDFSQRIKEGITFHRYKGTPYSLRQALSWYDLNDIIIEEEPQGEHYAEFQIGLDQIPNGFIVDTIVHAAKLASPLRSRLTRMYNREYDIRRFMLDDSPWGDLLSDHSGIVTEDGIKLSFGRSNSFYAYLGQIDSNYGHNRNYALTTKTMDLCRLDFAILCESDNHVLNHDSSMQRAYHRRNSDSIGQNIEKIFYPSTISKAMVVLSEPISFLDHLNTCFSGGYIKYDDVEFITSFSKLSEHKYTEELIYIDERFFRENTDYALNPFDPTAAPAKRTRTYSFNLINTQSLADYSINQEYHTTSTYHGNTTWHDHQHFNTEWNKQGNYAEISNDT